MKRLICELTWHLRLWTETAKKYVSWPKDFYGSTMWEIEQNEIDDPNGPVAKFSEYKVCWCGESRKYVDYDYEAVPPRTPKAPTPASELHEACGHPIDDHEPDGIYDVCSQCGCLGPVDYGS